MSARSAWVAAGDEARPSVNATGHQRDTGEPSALSTTPVMVSVAARRASAKRPSRTASTGGPMDGRRSSGSIPASAPSRRCRATIWPMAGASSRLPIAASASAARPCTTGLVSPSAMTSASLADRSPISPSENAAICRTSSSWSCSASCSAGIASGSPTRPRARAARRRTRPSESCIRRTRSEGGGGATTAGRPLVAGTSTTGAVGVGSRRIR